jgi:hypothetical protein
VSEVAEAAKVINGKWNEEDILLDEFGRDIGCSAKKFTFDAVDMTEVDFFSIGGGSHRGGVGGKVFGRAGDGDIDGKVFVERGRAAEGGGGKRKANVRGAFSGGGRE